MNDGGQSPQGLNNQDIPADISLEMDTDNSLSDFLLEAEAQNAEIVCRIYRKVKDFANGKIKHAFKDSFSGRVVAPDEIRAMYGTGDFYRVVYHGHGKTRKMKGQSICIEAGADDTPRNQTDIAALMSQMGNHNNNQLADLAPLLKIMQDNSNQTTQVLLKAMELGNRKESKVDSNQITAQYEILNSMTMRHAKSNAELIDMLTEAKLKNLDIEPDEDTVNQLFVVIKNLWDQWGDTVLKGGAQIKNLAKKAVQGSKEFEQIQSEPDAFYGAYNKLIEDGAEANKVNKLLSIVGIDVPSNGTAQAEIVE